MATATVPIHLPEPLFQRLKRAADLTHRTIEEIAVTSLEAALPAEPNFPSDIANELSALHLFSDEALWAAAEPSFSPAEELRLHQLNAAAGERDLTLAEEDEQKSLIAAYRKSVLRRAKALAILAQRGHSVSLLPETTATNPGRG